MIYDIRLLISYTFDQPTGAGRQVLRLMPVHLAPDQAVLSENLTITPRPGERRDFRDFFGTKLVEIGMEPGLTSLQFDLRARVQRMATANWLDVSCALVTLADDLAMQRDLGPLSPHHFLAASPRIGPVPAIVDFAQKATQGAATVREVVEILGKALHRTMVFDSTATDVDTTPDAAFQGGRGVCQDFAQIMIAGLRGLGVPAGYVSGFLRTAPPPGQPRLEGADAMHAWVMAWCGIKQGWVDYDPTNACFVASDHIVIARGRDYADAAPVTGMLRLGGGQKSLQAVDIVGLPNT